MFLIIREVVVVKETGIPELSSADELGVARLMRDRGPIFIMVSLNAKPEECDNGDDMCIDVIQMVVHVVHGSLIRRRSRNFGSLSSCRRGGVGGSQV